MTENIISDKKPLNIKNKITPKIIKQDHTNKNNVTHIDQPKP